MRSFIAFTLMLVLGTANVRADLVTYSMTATVTQVNVFSPTGTQNPSSAPVAVGDRIGWTFQYDRATPLIQSATVMDTTMNTYSPAGPLVTHLVDLTKGIALYTAPPGSIPAGTTRPYSSGKPYSSLILTRYPSRGIFQFQDNPPGTPTPYNADLALSTSQALPTMNLAQLRLDQLAIELNSPFSQFSYDGNLPGSNGFFDFNAQLNSLAPSVSIQSVPEPATSTLLAVGVFGLAVYGFRSPTRVGNDFPRLGKSLFPRSP